MLNMALLTVYLERNLLYWCMWRHAGYRDDGQNPDQLYSGPARRSIRLVQTAYFEAKSLSECTAGAKKT
jgi:hypothetical protein